MKKIKYIALGVFATLLSSCGNDWLDLQSSTAIETDGSLTELRDFEFVSRITHFCLICALPRLCASAILINEYEEN